MLGDDVLHDAGIIDHGRLIAEETPQAFINQLGSDVFHIEGSGKQDAFLQRIRQMPFVQDVNINNGRIQISAGEGRGRLVEIVQTSQATGFHIEDVSIAKPTLGDVFLKFTGNQLRDK